MQRNDSLIAQLRKELASTAPVRQLIGQIADRRAEVTGLSLEARALALAAIQETSRAPLAIITPGESGLTDFQIALQLFARDPLRVVAYPSPSLSPYQEVAPSLGVVREEIKALGMVMGGEADIVIVPARALFSRLPPRKEFADRRTRLAVGQELDVHALMQSLVENGFVRTDLVGEAGELAFRGGILDLFPPNATGPVRLELFGDTIESMRWFDAESQRSREGIESLTLLPMVHFPLNRETRHALARRLSLDFNDPLYKRDVAEKIERLQESGGFPGVEHYVPAAMPNVTLAEYLNEWTTVLIEPDQIVNAVAKYEAMLRAEYEVVSEKGKAAYPPGRLVAPSDQILRFLGEARVAFSDVHIKGRSSLTTGTTPPEPIRHPTSDIRHPASDFEEIRLHGSQIERYTNRLTEFTADLTRGHDQGKRQVFFAASKGGREKVERLLKEFNVPFADDAPQMRPELVVTGGTLARGFTIEEIALSIYSEWDLFEPPPSTRAGSRKKSTDAFIADLRDLKAGDFVVHLDHGVGRFVGLRRIPFGDTDREVMDIEYSSGGKLLLPMENLNLIQRFSAGEEAQPPLDRLGGTTWLRKKASVKKAMQDMAGELLKLYATRQMVHGHAFSRDSPWQFEFEESFEFEETEDQHAAIGDVKADMESRKPMDRLLCGDVGYGKTEVAMRAAFKAVMDGKQVAVLAPTTILAFQHYRTFLRRFASYPVTIDLLSRHYSPKEQKQLMAKMESGEIDVVIGTHRVLSRDIKFKDLGILVIDEEQRFGVAQKERLKQFKKNIDVLSMSATPIPRTLHMSLVGIRDISVIETPPKDRLAIQTAVVPFNDDFISEAITFEIDRGGQVFFVHNRIESIHAMKEYLEKTVPGLRVIAGHGQMDERELERALLAFINREYDVFLATTIIENGIDIPSCNTILVNHAERFGLSQLYQLRGRVGRSDRLAFCYLLVPSDRILASDARKRLAAIQEFSDLGAGFRIAAKDLEIRGAGNLLGGEQSGQIAAVGFEMYTKLLEETIREMKGERIEEEVETSMNLGVDIYIPGDYIDDENLRMMFYKKVASATTDERIEDIRTELRDRFGALPANVENLLHFVKVKRFAQSIGVISIVREGSRGVAKLSPKARVDPNKLLLLIGKDPQVKFSPTGSLSFPLQARGANVIDAIEGLLREIAA